MTTFLTSEWKSLFGDGVALGEQVRLHFLSRRGAPFLFLPAQRCAAEATLSLYPAQNRLARLVKKALGTGLHLGLPNPLPKFYLSIDSAAPFVRFLSDLAGSAGLPLWGMLAGNPGAAGRRFVFLIFGDDGSPRVIVKAGVGEVAASLIEQESEALRALPSGALGVCPIVDVWEGNEAKALALPYAGGAAPAPKEISMLFPLMMDWLAHGSFRSLGSLAGWIALDESGWRTRLEPLLSDPIEDVVVRSPIAHGDLAPWNIKSHAGRWTVIDWERGTLQGVPGWDWFHYTLQPGVLVRKWDAKTLVDEAGRVLESEPFQRYAEAARIRGLERALLLGYLVHCTEVIRQSEGREALVAAREALSRAWGVDR